MSDREALKGILSLILNCLRMSSMALNLEPLALCGSLLTLLFAWSWAHKLKHGKTWEQWRCLQRNLSSVADATSSLWTCRNEMDSSHPALKIRISPQFRVSSHHRRTARPTHRPESHRSRPESASIKFTKKREVKLKKLAQTRYYLCIQKQTGGLYTFALVVHLYYAIMLVFFSKVPPSFSGVWVWGSSRGWVLLTSKLTTKSHCQNCHINAFSMLWLSHVSPLAGACLRFPSLHRTPFASGLTLHSLQEQPRKSLPCIAATACRS